MRQKLRAKNKLKPKLTEWQKIMEAAPGEIEERVERLIKDNPFVEVKSKIQLPLSELRGAKSPKKRSTGEAIEALSFYEKSLYEALEEQITPPLFPTAQSQKIAFLIIENLDEMGFFEGSAQEIGESCGVSEGEVEKIRARFAHLEPPGVGAKDQVESMVFQILSLGLERDLADLCLKIAQNLPAHRAHAQNPLYEKALKTISRLRNAPAVAFAQKEAQIIPDIFVETNESGLLEVRINDSYYPNIVLYDRALEAANPAVKAKLREAKDLIDALDMRKATIGKIAAVIFDWQFYFFQNNEAIKPLTLKVVADELGYNPSTISRAISEKYLQCARGVFPLKHFFATALDEGTSNAAIKDFVKEQIEHEDRKNPLSDIRIQALIKAKFGIQIVRRTITKYRQQLNIQSSNERKKMYEI